MRYIGCKENLLPFIGEVVKAKKMDSGIFCDLFAGTASVSKHFKKLGYQIISNDILYFSYVLQKSQIEMNVPPDFSLLLESKECCKSFLEIERRNQKLTTSTPICYVLGLLNSLKGIKGFIYQNYCKEGTENSKFLRNYFSSENAQKIDAIRTKISEFKEKKLITSQEYFYLIACLIEAVSSVSNTSGTYGAFLKKTDPRSIKPLILTPVETIPSKHNNLVFCQDANILAAKIKADIVYLDPPYNTRQYAPYYHILETISKWDEPKIYGLTGRRPYRKHLSNYSKKQSAFGALNDLISKLNSEHILLSYNSEGILTQQQILKILSQKGQPEVFSKHYRRYKSNNGGSTIPLKEIVYYVHNELM